MSNEQDTSAGTPGQRATKTRARIALMAPAAPRALPCRIPHRVGVRAGARGVGRRSRPTASSGILRVAGALAVCRGPPLDTVAASPWTDRGRPRTDAVLLLAELSASKRGSAGSPERPSKAVPSQDRLEPWTGTCRTERGLTSLHMALARRPTVA